MKNPTPLSEEFSTRAVKHLALYKIYTNQDLLSKTFTELQSYKRIGKKSQKEIKEYYEKNNADGLSGRNDLNCSSSG